MSNFEYKEVRMADYGERNNTDINRVKDTVIERIEKCQNEITEHTRDPSVYSKLRDGIKNFNNSIDVMLQHQELLRNVNYNLGYHLVHIPSIIINPNEYERDYDTLEDLKFDSDNTVDQIKTWDSKTVSFYTDVITILEKYKEDIDEFLNEAERLRKKSKDEEARKYEARVRFIGHIFTEHEIGTLMDKRTRAYNKHPMKDRHSELHQYSETRFPPLPL